MIIVNFVAFVFLFVILAEIKLPSITGYATASPTVDIQSHVILAFVVLLAALALNTYFFTKGRNSLIKVKK